MFKCIGSFHQTTNKMIISDPCYDPPAPAKKNTLSLLNLEKKVKKGKWNTFLQRIKIGKKHYRNSQFAVLHQDLKHMNPLDLEWIDRGNYICVDSGQAGFFDKKYFGDDNNCHNMSMSKYIVGNSWYSMCCSKTDNKDCAGIIPNGAVSSTGWGDGAYKLYIHKNDEGKTVGLLLVFILEDSDSESDSESC